VPRLLVMFVSVVLFPWGDLVKVAPFVIPAPKGVRWSADVSDGEFYIDDVQFNK